MQNLNPFEDKIDVISVKHMNDGGIAIQCASQEDNDNIRKETQDKFSESYDASEVFSLSPRLRIVGMKEK